MNMRTGFLLLAAGVVTGMALASCDKSPPARDAVLAPPASDRNVADKDVSEHVKTALLQEPSLKGFDINVVTTKGDVRLIGVLDSQAQIDKALAIARAADGVHSIHDELSLRK